MNKVSTLNKVIRVLIVDDSAFLRELVMNVLNDDHQIEVVGLCEDGDEVCPMLSQVNADVVLMDIEMQRMNGDIATKEVLKYFPNVKVIAYSSHHVESYRLRMIQCGVKGYVNKSTPISQVVNIIKSVHSSQFVLEGIKMHRKEN